MGKLLFWVVIGVVAYFAWQVMRRNALARDRAAAQESIARDRAAGAGGNGGSGSGSGRASSSGGGSGSGGGGSTRSAGGPGDDGKAVGLESIVACAACGMHLPASEAVYAGGRAYCGAAHRDQARADHGS